MYFRNLPRSINSHRKTHNGPLFLLIRYEFFNNIRVSSYKTIIGSIGSRWWKKRIIHRIGTIVYFSENWSNSWWLDYIYTHTYRFVHMKSIFQIFLFDFPFACVSGQCSSLGIRSPFFEHVLISPSFVFYPIWKSCIIDRVKSKCLTPIEIRPTRERNRYVRGEEGRHGEDRIQGQRGREREKEKHRWNPMWIRWVTEVECIDQ